MKLVIVTIVQNGMPWISCHYPEFRKLQVNWEWHVCEGTANSEQCTSWCKKMRPGLSSDGTTEYLDSLAWDPRVFLYRSEMWHGKLEMVNCALKDLHEPCVLVQADADELWTAIQLERIYELLRDNHHTGTRRYNSIFFYCRYFLGPDIVITSKDTFGNRTDFEWLRAWAWAPGMRFLTHEPPKLDQVEFKPMPHRNSQKHGLVFDHMAYATEEQVANKAEYYGSPNNQLGHLYSDAVEGWHRLQHNTKWPVKVRDFLRFVKDDAVAERIKP